MVDRLLEELPEPPTRPVMLTSVEAAERAGMSAGAWRVMIHRGQGPDGSCRQGKHRMWPKGDFDRWLKDRETD